MLELQNLTKRFKNFELQSINLTIEAGDYYVILGPSGSGKSMILELITGLQQPDSGHIMKNNKDICKCPIQKRGIGLLFQDFALFPHMSVFDNIAYSLKLTPLSREEIDKRVHELATQFELTEFLTRKPDTLSGGESQRLALARTLATKPDILLLDEPLSSLDVSLRNSFRKILYRLNQEGQTIIHVTHDYEEAGILANKIAVLHKGVVVQEGNARDILGNPRSEFTAQFCGYKNFFPAQIIKAPDQQHSYIHLANYDQIITSHPENYEGNGFLIIDEKFIKTGEPINPEAHTSTTENQRHGIILEIIPDNHFYDMLVDVGFPLHIRIPFEKSHQNHLKEGDPVTLSFDHRAIRFIKPQ